MMTRSIYAKLGLPVRLIALLAASSLAVSPCHAQTKPVTGTSPQMAAYRWGISPDSNAAFAQWIGLDNVWAEDFEPPETWDNIANPGWQLWPWGQWAVKNPDRRLILSIPMLPGSWDRSGPQKGLAAKQPVSLQAGANGDYNGYYETLAKNLVKQHLEKSILRIGWEMNGGWYTWRGSDNPKAWAAYFAQIVKTMRAVDGAQDLKFCWNPATDYLQFPADTAYPGDDVVDIIGIDVYDQSWMKNGYPFPKDASEDEIAKRQKKVWDEWVYGGNHGLKYWNEFTQQHHKPLAICEWGICDRKDGHGGLDNPYFIEQMHQFIADPANNVMFHCYFDVEAPDGKHQLSPGKDGKHITLFPKSAAKFQELFGGPTTKPSSQPAQ